MKMQDKIIIVVIVLGIGFGLGWAVNGWRLSGKIESLKTLESDNVLMHNAINVQNSRILELEHDSQYKIESARLSVKIATEANKHLEGQLRLLRQATGKSCDDANDLLNKVIE
jgi:hypothetical protein